jgi:hypothetical protein
MVLLVLMVAMAAFTSLGTTSPRYSMQHAMYFPIVQDTAFSNCNAAGNLGITNAFILSYLLS